MKKQSPRTPSQKNTQKPKPLTRDNLIPILEDIKDLIKSTATATQTILRKEMDEKFTITWAAIKEHTQQIKGLDQKIEGVRTDLKDEMHQMEKRLSDKIDVNNTRLDNHETRILVLEQRP